MWGRIKRRGRGRGRKHLQSVQSVLYLTCVMTEPEYTNLRIAKEVHKRQSKGEPNGGGGAEQGVREGDVIEVVGTSVGHTDPGNQKPFVGERKGAVNRFTQQSTAQWESEAQHGRENGREMSWEWERWKGGRRTA
jgi:hypothetical protein